MSSLNSPDLPNELLSEIFRLAMGNPISRCKTRASIALVCKRWKDVLQGSPSLWTTIVFKVEDFSRAGHFAMTDVSYLACCLALSHPHPLDITIMIHFVNYPGARYNSSLLSQLKDVLGVLRSHSIRWRSFSFTAPGWVFDMPLVESFISQRFMPQLQSLTLLVGPENSASPNLDVKLTSSNGPPVSLSIPTLLRLCVNFPLPRFVVDWSILTSFTGGLDSYTHLFDAVSRMGALKYLHITHIGTSGLKSLETPLVFSSLSHLKLSTCAISGIAAVALYMRVPKLTQLSLSDSLPVSHAGTGPCIGSGDATAEMADTLFLMLALSGAEARIVSLDISMQSHVGCPFLVHFFELASLKLPVVTSLLVSLSAEINQPEVDAFLDQLIGGCNNKLGPSLAFPELNTLELQGTNCADRGDKLFLGPTLEVLIRSRWPGKLQKLRLRRVKPKSECLHDCLEKSSLALTLLTFRSQGLDVQFLDGTLDKQGGGSMIEDIDVLDEAAKYQ